ncbi:MAG: dienelactone hydrolase family protein [Verrucomicrobia bacterium]|nr:dienelactone hydrolase family protein [Verrucomicrobiota bacterium]
MSLPHAPVWPPQPLTPSYTVRPIHTEVRPDKSVVREVRLEFKDWMDRPVSLFARKEEPAGQGNGGGVLHIVGGAQTIHPGDLEVWVTRGYVAASFDWQIEGVGNRPPERTTQFPPDLVTQFNATKSLQSAVLPVAFQCACVCLHWLSESNGVDPDKLGVVGISWGGYLSWILAAYHNGVSALVPAFGCGGLFASNGSQPEHGPEVMKFWQQHLEPPVLVPRIKAPVCFLNSTNDFFGRLSTAERMLESLTGPCTRLYSANVDHSLNPAQTNLAIAWMEKHLLGNHAALPSPDSMHDAHTAIWWTADLTLPENFRCWLPAPILREQPVQAFSIVTCNGISQCSPVVYADAMSAGDPADNGAVAGYIRFGLGWRWESGSTRHFANNARATAPDRADKPWLFCPARPDNPDEAIAVILHSCADFGSCNKQSILHLGWSIQPRDGLPPSRFNYSKQWQRGQCLSGRHPGRRRLPLWSSTAVNALAYPMISPGLQLGACR